LFFNKHAKSFFDFSIPWDRGFPAVQIVFIDVMVLAMTLQEPSPLDQLPDQDFPFYVFFKIFVNELPPAFRELKFYLMIQKTSLLK
jgi:hypothetical protein